MCSKWSSLLAEFVFTAAGFTGLSIKLTSRWQEKYTLKNPSARPGFLLVVVVLVDAHLSVAA